MLIIGHSVEKISFSDNFDSQEFEIFRSYFQLIFSQLELILLKKYLVFHHGQPHCPCLQRSLHYIQIEPGMRPELRNTAIFLHGFYETFAVKKR